MIVRSDLNEKAFDQLILSELEDQLQLLEREACADNWKLREAFRYVIAYNTVPGSYEEGKYDV